MKISYDPKVDAMYIRLASGRYSVTKKVSDNVLVDVTKGGKVLGLEILDAKGQFGEIKPERIEFSQKPSYKSP